MKRQFKCIKSFPGFEKGTVVSHVKNDLFEDELGNQQKLADLYPKTEDIYWVEIIPNKRSLEIDGLGKVVFKIECTNGYIDMKINFVDVNHITYLSTMLTQKLINYFGGLHGIRGNTKAVLIGKLPIERRLVEIVAEEARMFISDYVQWGGQVSHQFKTYFEKEEVRGFISSINKQTGVVGWPA